MEADVLEFLYPKTALLQIGQQSVEVESLGFLEWYAFQVKLEACLNALLQVEIAEGVCKWANLMEDATGLSASEMPVADALVAFRVWVELNDAYVDPDLLVGATEQAVEEKGLRNSVLTGWVATLATRFTMSEIEAMQPSWALQLWKAIIEEQALNRAVIFYSTELGYDKKSVQGGKAYKLKPRPCPYLPPWYDARGRRQQEVGDGPPPRAHFVTQPDKVVDLTPGLRKE